MKCRKCDRSKYKFTKDIYIRLKFNEMSTVHVILILHVPISNFDIIILFSLYNCSIVPKRLIYLQRNLLGNISKVTCKWDLYLVFIILFWSRGLHPILHWLQLNSVIRSLSWHAFIKACKYFICPVYENCSSFYEQ